ncbi:MAG: GNAT family N-acetyltransferase [Lachnospiraceae bacterium]|nr:GNAT family N-acetyltransferase [Lachnospiraceae bacterium]
MSNNIIKKGIAIIPARYEVNESKQKCLSEFCKLPVISYSIRAALDSQLFDEVMVSTDNEIIANVAIQYGAKVPFYRNTGKAYHEEGINDVLNDVISNYKRLGKIYDYICCIYPVAPFVTRQVLLSNFNILINSDADAIIPLIKYNYPPQRCFVLDSNGFIEYKWPSYRNKNSKEIDPVFRDAGQFFFVKTQAFIKEKSFIPSRTIPFVLTTMEHQDLYDEFGWIIAEYKYNFLRDVQLRDAVIGDADIVFEWRNDAETRKNSFNHDVIIYDNHIQWFKKTLDRNDVKLFMLTVGGVPVGQARIDSVDEGYEISYLIGTEYRGRGYGSMIIKLLENKVVELYGNVNVSADVLKENIVSQRVFLNLGFEQDEWEDRFVYKKLAVFHGEYVG